VSVVVPFPQPSPFPSHRAAPRQPVAADLPPLAMKAARMSLDFPRQAAIVEQLVDGIFDELRVPAAARMASLPARASTETRLEALKRRHPAAAAVIERWIGQALAAADRPDFEP
jgi:hypothetical protein